MLYPYIAIVNSKLLLTIKAESDEDAAQAINDASEFIEDMQIIDYAHRTMLNGDKVLKLSTISLGELYEMGYAIRHAYSVLARAKRDCFHIEEQLDRQEITPRLRSILTESQQTMRSYRRIYEEECAAMGADPKKVERKILDD